MADREVIKGTVASKSRKGNSIKMEDGNWYGVYKAEDLNHVNWKDEVEFLWEFDKTGSYRNIKGKVKVLGASTGGSSVSSPAPRGGGFNNLGVELGHASNLAMHSLNAEGCTPASAATEEEYYRTFASRTIRFYKEMKTLRDAAEKALKASPAVSDSAEDLPIAKVATPAGEDKPFEPETVDDIF